MPYFRPNTIRQRSYEPLKYSFGMFARILKRHHPLGTLHLQGNRNLFIYNYITVTEEHINMFIDSTYFT